MRQMGSSMVYDVLITQDANKRYIARVLAFPDILVSGCDETEVLQQVHAAIAHLQNNSRIVRLNVPSPTERQADPWLRAAGMWAQDPDWKRFQKAVQDYRQKMDTQPDSPA